MKKFLGGIIVIGAVLAGLIATGYINGNKLLDAARALYDRPTLIADKLYERGEFKGTLTVDFESLPTGDGSSVELVLLKNEFGYRDSKGVEWTVPAGEISDGASIPTLLWPFFGGPFSGPYRSAAIIHDYYCNIQERPWEQVHEMFLEAALKAGTGEIKAKSMYAGILYGGPRWGNQEARNQSRTPTLGIASAHAAEELPIVEGCAKLLEKVKEKSNKDRFTELKVWIETDKPSLKEIQACVAKLRKMPRV